MKSDSTNAAIACYCRVSSLHQKNDAQRAEISRWLSANGLGSADVQWFEDTETAKTLDRPAFKALQKAIFDGIIRTVVVWKLDRLSRNQQDGINLLANWCEKGIRIVAVTQQLDLSGPLGRMVAGVLFGLAEIELEYRRERQAAGIRVARAKGVYQGRLKGTTKAAPQRVHKLRQRGLTAVEIAKALGVSERTVFRYLNTVQSLAV
jgi:DNA invertase Pin-like site-specific DNA recombinase